MESDKLKLKDVKPVKTSVERVKLADELLSNQKEYVGFLRTVVEFFFKPINLKRKRRKETVLSEHDIAVIFQNIVDIYEMEKSFCEQLELARYNGPTFFVDYLGRIVLQFLPWFKFYSVYLSGVKNGMQVLVNNQRKNENFRIFLEFQEMCTGISLKDLLSKPASRLQQMLQSLAAICDKAENYDEVHT